MTDTRATLLDNGATIAGYRVVSLVGKGAMGWVYQAVQLSMERLVALKVLAPGLAEDEAFVERFLREARLAASIGSPYVVCVHDAGIDEGVLYISMELADGGDCRQLARDNGGRLPADRVATIMRDGARGLVAIHRAGLVHRDIKPANLFASTDGQTKLGDLGLAHDLTDQARISNPGLVVGTPAFMSPEQAKAEASVDIRSDIYSLGATCFRLLTGTDPFPGSDLSSILGKVLAQQDPALTAPLASCAAGRLAPIIRRCMERDRDARYQSPAELLAVLDRLLEPDTVETKPVETASGRQAAVRRRSAPRLNTARQGRKPRAVRIARLRRRRLGAVIQWCVLGGLALLALALAGSRYL